MIELPFAIACSVALFMIGVMGGMLLHYYGDHRPLETRYAALVEILVNMKKQGFVRQFEVEQVKEVDPSNGIDES